MRENDWVTVEQAKQMRNGINVKGRITRKSEVRPTTTKFGETTVCDANLADDSGSIKLILWAGDTEKVKNGDAIKLENAYTTTFRNVVQLNKGRRDGKLEVVRPDKSFPKSGERDVQPQREEEGDELDLPFPVIDDDGKDPFERIKDKTAESQEEPGDLEKKIGNVSGKPFDLGTFDDFINWIYAQFEEEIEVETRTRKKFYARSVSGEGITITPKATGTPRTISEDQLKKLFRRSEKLPFSKVREISQYDPKHTGVGQVASYYTAILEHWLESAPYNVATNLISNSSETGGVTDGLDVADKGPMLVRSPEHDTIVEKITDELLIEKDMVYRMMDYLASGNHILLEGPIGTGKTHLARLLPELFSNEKFRYESKMYTATSEWTTQEVIGGIVPKMQKDGRPMYDINYGCVVETLRKNLTSDGTEPKTRYWTVIDEFNRAPIDKSFGPLFTALRDGRLGQIPSKEHGETYDEMPIPRDYRIIGTLNTQDKSLLFTVSNALRSRFVSVRIGVPEKEKANKEIYFAAKHALEKLAREDNYKDIIVLDHEAKRLDEPNTDIPLLQDLKLAYWVLASVRLFYELGTALLVEMYKIIIDEKDFVMRENIRLDSSGLDEALTAKLIPQLDQLTKAKLRAIRALHEEHGVVKLFKRVHQTRDRKKYDEAFGKVLEFLDCSNDDLVKSFEKDAEFKTEKWDVIEKAQESMKDNLYEFTGDDGINNFITELKGLEERSTI